MFVWSGQIVVEVGDERLHLGEGTFLRLPSDRPYAYLNGGEGPARFLRAFMAG